MLGSQQVEQLATASMRIRSVNGKGSSEERGHGGPLVGAMPF